MRKYLITIFAVCLFYITNAQVVTTVCGTDTIVLRVDNYINGVIEWEESLDNISWVPIVDAKGLTYKFFPTETKYYRASVKTSDCPPLNSAVTLVQLKPQAYAGSDREIGGSKTKLLGSFDGSSTGTWSILEGTGANIVEKNNPYSEFSGVYGQKYKLIWTSTNGCGQSQDTVLIEFQEIIAKNNYIVVDETDLILGDTLERKNGIYRIKFSDASIVPSDTMLLIGMRRDISFLVKIQSFSLKNGVYTFTTTEGKMEDIIQSGTINVGDAVNEGMVKDSKKKSNSFPTRATLKELQGNKDQIVLYSSDFTDKNGNREYMREKAINSGGMVLKVPDMDLFSTPEGALKVSLANTYVRFKPNFVCDFKIGFFTLNNIKIGLDNGEFEYNYKLKIDATVKKELSKEITIFEYTNNIVFVVGVVPVVISTSIAVNAEASIAASATLSVTEEKNYQKNFTALLVGDKLKEVRFVSFSSSKSTSKSDYVLQGRLDADFSVGPEISVELYNVIGPYFELPLTLHAGICANTQGNWNAEAGLGIEGNLGVKAHLGKFELFDIKHTLFKAELIKPLILPYKIDILSGNYQKAMKDALLPKPIDIKVVSSYGFGVPFVPVRFSLAEGNGTITSKVRYTDKNGMVSVNDWLLGENTDAQLDISVLNCYNDDIEDFSPISAYASTFNCTNTDLSILLAKTETAINIRANGGTAPYTYSTDNIVFTSNPPVLNYTSPGKFKVFIKDANKCRSNRTITVEKPDWCKTKPLFIDLYTAANTIQFTGINGKLPYQFSIDNTTSYAATNLYSNLTAGKHKVYMKDANGCTAVDSFVVDAVSAKAINALTPRNNAVYYNPKNVIFTWQAAKFTTGQLYDLYLKQGTDAYVNIAKNLSTENYTHTLNLNFGTKYTWKIVVKDPGGIEKENAEFTFTTMADPAILAVTPTLLLPANNALTDTTVTLTWQSQGGDFKYDVYIDGLLQFYSLTGNSAVLNNLKPDVTYNWKVKIKSPTSTQSKESAEQVFKTKTLLPVIKTDAATNIEAYKTTIGGQVTHEGLSPVTERGICWSTSPLPAINSNSTTIVGSGEGAFTTTISNLIPETKYYFRAFAINKNGTAYGNEETFTTLTKPIFDGDGNAYSIIQIGTQTWMQQNLKTTKYNDGTPISGYNSPGLPCYRWHNDNIKNKDIYGALYSWYATNTISTGGKNICPVGYHVPTDAEWKVLQEYLGGTDLAGGKMKARGTSLWLTPNTGATNESGFTALPGANWDGSNKFYNNIGETAVFWTSSDFRVTAYDVYGIFYRVAFNGVKLFSYTTSKDGGASVRCIKN